MVRELLLLLFTILCSVLFAETAVDIDNRKMNLRSVGQCKGARNRKYSLMWTDLQLKHDNNTGNMMFKLKANLKKEISKDLSIVFNFWKCDASGNPDSCEVVLKDNNVTDICSYIEEDDQAWTEFMRRFDKPVHCPIKPGVYKMEGLEIKPDILKFLPLGNAVWILQLQGFDKGEMISCAEVVVQLISNYKGN